MENNENKRGLSDVGEEVFVKRPMPASPPVRPHNMDGMPKGHPNAPHGGQRMPPPGAKGRPLQSRPQKMQKPPLKKKAPIPSQKSTKNVGRREKKHFALFRKTAIIGFSFIGLISLILCTVLAYSYSGDSIKHISQMTESGRSSSREYVIVYSESDVWGAGAAEYLKELFLQKTGASLKIVPDTESLSRHEIRVGHTNRSGDDYITTAAALGKNGYAVLLQSGNNVALAALSEAGARTAVKYFVDSYVGSYISGKLTLSRNISISFVGRDGSEPLMSLRSTKKPLNFTENGKFKLLVLSDADINPNTVNAIEAIAETEKPNLVIFSGDASSGIATKAELEEYLSALTKPLEENKIPWAVTFGEQDTDGGLSAEAQMEVYSSFEYCVSKSEITSDGAISCFLPIYPFGEIDNGSVPLFGIWAMGQTPMISATASGASGEPLLSDEIENGADYGYVPSSHVAWFSENQKVLDREASGKMPTVIVTHTPLQEFEIVAANPEETRMLGNYGEDVASSPINSGLFASALGSGSVLGIYSGHDHLNAFSGKYCGIELGYAASIGYDGYGLGGTFEINNSLRGGRMIELTIKDGDISLSSRMVYASDYGIGLK